MTTQATKTWRPDAGNAASSQAPTSIPGTDQPASAQTSRPTGRGALRRIARIATSQTVPVMMIVDTASGAADGRGEQRRAQQREPEAGERLQDRADEDQGEERPEEDSAVEKHPLRPGEGPRPAG